ncbi:hypothetical protein IFM89_038957 [Coptis chinensis]|uniref:DNA/RNA-binding protein Alba-like domain-containing protein n=1 Tax=Coptis chinensis TaxID=261450 RepID=A0A835MGX5_9MAGN|nr:hypothetical protein IFM89_038957 [Coptis chinensis]
MLFIFGGVGPLAFRYYLWHCEKPLEFSMVLLHLLRAGYILQVEKPDDSDGIIYFGNQFSLLIRHEFYRKPREELSVTIDIPGEDVYHFQPRLFGKDKGSNEIVLKAMGRAINKNVMIVELIKRRIASLHQNTSIGSTDITDMWERLWKKAKRITSQSDESCSPQAPRQGS